MDFNVYVYFTGQEACLEEDEFYSFIYSQYRREQIATLGNDELAHYISSTFQLYLDASKAILSDYLILHSNIKSTHMFESIMRPLYFTEKSLLAKRIKAFHEYDLNKDGYLSAYELNKQFTLWKRASIRQHKPGHMVPINKVIENYAMNNSLHLNFLGFNKYVSESVTDVP